MNKKIAKYFLTFSEPEVLQLKDFPTHQQFQYSLVVPLFHESIDFYQTLIQSAFIQQSILVILVINQPTGCIDEQQLQLWNKIGQLSTPIWNSNQMQLRTITGSNSGVLLVDRFSNNFTIPIKQGVGLARKIGCDIASWLIFKGLINCHFIGSTDGDAQLPDNYFCCLPSTSDIAVVMFNFKHQSADINDSSKIYEATELYEKSLHYYVAGLSWAGSAYAFYTIGSIIAINANQYCQARGFPKRQAAEDFYLINKLAKLGKVETTNDATVLIKARLSDRVPFGTGPAVNSILKLSDIEQYESYHPEVFYKLKNTLNIIGNCWTHKTQLEHYFTQLSSQSYDALESAGFFAFIKKLHKQRVTEQQFNKQIIHWFDGFKTLKFIHYLKNNHYPNLQLHDAIRRAPFISSRKF